MVLEWEDDRRYVRRQGKRPDVRHVCLLLLAVCVCGIPRGGRRGPVDRGV